MLSRNPDDKEAVLPQKVVFPQGEAPPQGAADPSGTAPTLGTARPLDMAPSSGTTHPFDTTPPLGTAPTPGLDKALRLAGGISLVGAPLLWAIGQGPMVLGWLAGSGWNGLNLWLLQRIASLLLRPMRTCRRPLIALLLAKFWLLYPAGIWILWSGVVSRLGFVLGFTAVLFSASLGLILRPGDLPRLARGRLMPEVPDPNYSARKE